MFKLIKVEFKKAFHQPLVYIMAVILCLSLILSLFIFSPAKRSNSASSFSLVSSNVSEAKQNFQTKKTVTDTGIEKLKTSIQNYKASNAAILLQNYKNIEGQTLSQLFAIYDNLCKNAVSTDDTTLLNKNLNALHSTLVNIKTVYKDIVKEITNDYIPTVKLTTKTNDQILRNLENAIKETDSSLTLDVNAHKKINDTLNAKQYALTFKSLFASISDTGLSQNEIDKIVEKYFDTDYTQKQNTLAEKINEAETQQEVYNLAKQYHTNAFELTQISYLIIYTNLTNNLKDGEIQGLYNSKLLSQKTNFYSTSVTKYAINEKLTYYTHLWDNNLQDYNMG